MLRLQGLDFVTMLYFSFLLTFISFLGIFTDYKPVVQLVKLLVETYVTPCSPEAENPSAELTDKILHLLLCVLDGLYHANDLSTVSHVSIQWAPVFNLRNTR